ncbi:MAG: ZIP family metal transporter [Planctomycetes bacterium]|nr:ZIP family metal transporter [Planctomycetota bacterium]
MTDLVWIFAVSLLGGYLPLLVHWTDRLRHAALALSTGIFLAAVFLHLLPSLGGLVDGHTGPGGLDGRTVWLCVLLGLLGVYLVEALVLRTHDKDENHRHRAVGWAALVGLTVHALTTGVGYAAASARPDVSDAMLMAILTHKGFESFSLLTVFQLGHFPRRQTLLMVLLFSAVTPAGALAGKLFADGLADSGVLIATALAAGTFLFVCVGELLPEVFHHREDILVKIGLLAAGVGLTMIVH